MREIEPQLRELADTLEKRRKSQMEFEREMEQRHQLVSESRERKKMAEEHAYRIGDQSESIEAPKVETVTAEETKTPDESDALSALEGTAMPRDSVRVEDSPHNAIVAGYLNELCSKDRYFSKWVPYYYFVKVKKTVIIVLFLLFLH